MRLALAAALVLAPALARGEGASDAFFSLIRDHCIPALEQGRLPEPVGMEPVYPAEMKEHGAPVGLENAYVGEYPDLLITFGDVNGALRCTVSYIKAGPPEPSAVLIASALRQSTYDLATKEGWKLLDDCDPGSPYVYRVVIGSTGTNPNGRLLRAVAFAAWGSASGEEPGGPSFVVGETDAPSDVICIDLESTQ